MTSAMHPGTHAPLHPSTSAPQHPCTSAQSGMHFVATYDQSLINQWTLQQDEIEERLDAMRRDLRPPYDRVTLPQVLRPEEILPSGEEEN